ncbi:hypothetical protein [Galbibacter sp.]|uniref:hypothetical protein n=1 Tax=Galbibacter sp. TaxID=2918471 RepID=UPI003A95D944
MKKLLKTVLFACAMVVISNVYTQDISGIVRYKGMLNRKYVDSFITAIESKKEVSMHIKQIVADGHLNATPDEYTLNIKGEESYYYMEPKLSENPYDVGSKAGGNSFYTKKDSIITESTIGYILHKPINWEISQETKKLGKYTCY